MKREELTKYELAARFRTMRDELRRRAHIEAPGSPEFCDYDGQASAYDHAADLAVNHLPEPLPANSITLQLPVYAAGDPKAGEVVNIGDRVFFRYGPPGTVETYIYGEDGIGIQCEFQRSVERRYSQFFSTAAARDAALKAAEEAASNE